MDSANSTFRACFFGIGYHGDEIGKHVLPEFNGLTGYFEKYRNDDPTFSADRNEHPRLTVLSLKENQDNPIQDISNQDIIFLLGSQQDQLFWTTRDKLISANKCSFIFTLILSRKGDVGCHHQSSNNESIIFFEESDSEKQITQFVKDMCRIWMFPRLLSCDFSCMTPALSGTKGKFLSFESQTADRLPPFRQFLSNNLETIQRASGIFFIVSSNSDHDFSIAKHLQPVIDEIKNTANGECTVIGSDSLYAEREAAFKVTMICGENDRILAPDFLKGGDSKCGTFHQKIGLTRFRDFTKQEILLWKIGSSISTFSSRDLTGTCLNSTGRISFGDTQFGTTV